MIYDFKAARNQIEELTLTYRSLKYKGQLDERNSRFLLSNINELETEIAEAKEKMAALDGHHLSMQKNNLIAYIIPSSHYTNKGEPQNEYSA